MDRLEFQLKNKVAVIRFDVSSDLGKVIRNRYDSTVVPTFIMLNKYGNEIWRITGTVPNIEQIKMVDF